MQNISSFAAKVPKRLVLSYVIDWLLIIIVAAAGGGFSFLPGAERVFTLDDPDISYPLYPDTVSFAVVGLVALVFPAILIVVLSLTIVPLPHTPGSRTLSRKWLHRARECNAGCMGLAVSVAGSLFVTEALKSLIGKPRPDLLARCIVDVSRLNHSVVSGLKMDEAYVYVTSRICAQKDAQVLRDGFASFPSGHSSFAFSGLLYLSLWLSAKLAVASPARRPGRGASATTTTSSPGGGTDTLYAGHAAPVYLLVLPCIPVAVALYIASTRYADYHHAGFDVICGCLLGAFFAILTFLWFFQPARTGVAAMWRVRHQGAGGSNGLERSNTRDVETGYGSEDLVLGQQQPHPHQQQQQQMHPGSFELHEYPRQVQAAER